jgi:hypothetical protein
MLIFLLYSAVYIETQPPLPFSSPVPSIGRAEGLLPFSALRSLRPWSDYSQTHGSRTALKFTFYLAHFRALSGFARTIPPTLFDSNLFPPSTCTLFFTTVPAQSPCFQSLPHFFHANGGCTLSRRCSVLATRVIPTRSRSLSPLEATLASQHISVVSKGLMEYLNPLYATLTKNRGRGGAIHGPLSSYGYNKKKLQTVQPTAAGLANSYSRCISRSACSCEPLLSRSLPHVRFRTVLKLRKTENEVWKLLEGDSCTRNQSSPWLS